MILFQGIHSEKHISVQGRYQEDTNITTAVCVTRIKGNSLILHQKYKPLLFQTVKMDILELCVPI